MFLSRSLVPREQGLPVPLHSVSLDQEEATENGYDIQSSHLVP